MNSRLDFAIRRQGMVCHLLGLSGALWLLLVGFFLSTESGAECLIAPFLLLQRQPLCGWMIPLCLLLLGPAVTGIYELFQQRAHPFVAAQAKEVLNFQLSVSGYALVALVLFNLFLSQAAQNVASPGIPTAPFWIGVLIALFLFPVLTALQSFLVILGTIQAANGLAYRYPLTIRWLR